MQHKGTVPIETERLILNRLTFEDIYMINHWHRNDNVSRYMAWESCKSFFETCQLLDMWLNDYQRMNRYLWGIRLKKENKLIGRIKLVNMNEFVSACEADYCLSEEFWGNGYASEALMAVIEFAFNQMNANKVYACHILANKASERVMQKCHMQREGTLRDHIKKESGYYDCNIYSILQRDFLYLDDEE